MKFDIMFKNIFFRILFCKSGAIFKAIIRDLHNVSTIIINNYPGIGKIHINYFNLLTDKYHNINGPAIIVKSYSGKIYDKKYYLDGIEYDKTNYFLNKLKYKY